MKKWLKEVREMKIFEKRLPILMPDARWRKYWDFLILLIVVYSAVLVPFNVGFEPVTK